MVNRAMGRAAAVAALAAAAAACGQADGTQVGADDDADRGRRINVEVAEVQPRDFTHYVRIVGTVEAERDVTISAEESGTVVALLARPGQRVRAGQPLMRLDAGVLRAQLEQAVSQAELAEEMWQRHKRLWEEDGVGTEMAYLQARYNARTALAQAQVLHERLARTTVRSPIGGLMEERRVEVGSMVAPGTPVARILDVDTVKVVGGVPERYATEISAGGDVVVRVDRLGGREFVGSISHVSAAVDRSSRTFTVEVEVDNAGLPMKPGMVATIQLARARVEGALVVPRHAVLRREGGYQVYVAAPDGDDWRAEARSVVPGVARGDELVITAGLDAGERVVVVGQQRVAHGDLLVITTGNARAAAVEGTDG